jgi:glycosyltransferase involved in cell wall biosynthesis
MFQAQALQRCGDRMPAASPLSASILICTYNRAALLRKTLSSLRDIRSHRTWDIVVVDNNSSDDTRQVVESFARTSAVPVAYLFEPKQGKSNALNTGIRRSTGDIIAFTDDDVEVASSWLEEACAPLDRDESLDYTGGPVRPLWEATPPEWLDQTRGDLWGTLAIVDYGSEPFVFEERQRVPLGVNMAVRRSLIARIGGFHPELGRRGRSLLGQEQAEFLARARSLDVRGMYVPPMEVAHHVSATRLTKRYFRRWWFWKGVSRARVESVHRRTELGLDLTKVPYVAKVPRYVWGQLPRSAWKWLRSLASGDPRDATRHEMQLVYTAGYVWATWTSRPIRSTAPSIQGRLRAAPATSAASALVGDCERTDAKREARVAVLFATYNRAYLLGETLDSLAASRVPSELTWEVTVIDNNSSDNTRAVVTSRQPNYPVPLHYLLEPRQGRSSALNAGIAATSAPLLLFTDDDVRVDPDWLEAGATALADGADYVGGPVRPLWGAPPPSWLARTRSDLWGTIAILDYGSETFVFEDRCLVPLGANMGMRRSLVDTVGLFRNELGRSAGRRLLGQEVPELLTRVRAAGLRGVYVPAMAVHHHVPAARLTRGYFRRWWMGKGYSKALFEAVQPVTELGLDLRTVPHIGAIPRYLLGEAARDLIGWLRAMMRADEVTRFRYEMRLAYFLGFIRARGLWRQPPYLRSAPQKDAAPAIVP